MTQATIREGRSNAVRESVGEIWLAGLGALALTEEEGIRFFRSLVKKGAVVEKRSRARLGDTLAAAKGAPVKALSAIERRVDNSVESVMHRLGVPTRREITGLTRRIEGLASAMAKKPAPARPRRARTTSA